MAPADFYDDILMWPKVQEAYNVASYADEVILLGSIGTGKTFISRKLAHDALAAGETVLFVADKVLQNTTALHFQRTWEEATKVTAPGALDDALLIYTYKASSRDDLSELEAAMVKSDLVIMDGLFNDDTAYHAVFSLWTKLRYLGHSLRLVVNGTPKTPNLRFQQRFDYLRANGETAHKVFTWAPSLWEVKPEYAGEPLEYAPLVDTLHNPAMEDLVPERLVPHIALPKSLVPEFKRNPVEFVRTFVGTVR